VKILIPILSFGREGGYKVLSKLANEFVRKGHDVDFLVPYFSSSPYHSTNANIIWVNKKGDLTTNKINSSDKSIVWKSVYLLWLGLKKASNNGYDVILANHSLTTFPIYFSGICGRKHYYIQAYEPEFYEELRGFKNRFLQWLSKKSYSLPFNKIVNSKIYCKYKEIIASEVVYPGIDFSTYYPKANFTISNTKIKIGTIARREPHKGTAFVIEAYNKIFEKRKDVELHLAFGDACLEDKDKNIFVCQPHGDDELANYYRSMDVYCCALTSQHGAIHYPVLETMTSGTSLITTDYFPATSANAYMIKPSNAYSIVKAFEYLLEDEEKRLEKIKQGIQDVQQFSWNKVSDKMLSILQLPHNEEN
jgi:glycosyltransferase involved in cell wall biosynthesis